MVKIPSLGQYATIFMKWSKFPIWDNMPLFSQTDKYRISSQKDQKNPWVLFSAYFFFILNIAQDILAPCSVS